MTYDSVIIEVSGKCNAKCPYCCTGNGTNDASDEKPYMDLDLFKQITEKLIKNKMINKKTSMSLYNWGEPMLNPQITEITQYLNDRKINYNISTNASVYKNLINPSFIAISMPGFSQESYDKIHGFNFNKILGNIDKFYNSIDPKKIYLKYFVYKFNLNEIQKAKDYCEERWGG